MTISAGNDPGRIGIGRTNELYRLGLVFNNLAMADKPTAYQTPWSDYVCKTLEVGKGVAKGIHSYQAMVGYRYAIQFNTSRSCLVTIRDTITGTWVIRLDRAHATGATYNHININPKLTGLSDPHICLPPGMLTACQFGAKLARGYYEYRVDDMLFAVSIGFDMYRAGTAIYQDYGHGTTRNTLMTGAKIAGGWSGAPVGALIGAKIGSLLPGLGTIIGGLAGGIAGGVYGPEYTQGAVSAICDKLGHDIQTKPCTLCDQSFQAKVYSGEGALVSCPGGCKGTPNVTGSNQYLWVLQIAKAWEILGNKSYPK
ncbi:unnamed protein product [Oppiella nova]|uniref:Uncharacterized protein n=1 Tax=Oppiella nova TaxID=334625 RepID=A0A7R9M7K4_9ACAR|nr:unnamed protein product [Oppiella nova]CAG2172102.1 unnamed protein product [Oppiella nova]